MSDPIYEDPEEIEEEEDYKTYGDRVYDLFNEPDVILTDYQKWAKKNLKTVKTADDKAFEEDFANYIASKYGPGYLEPLDPNENPNSRKAIEYERRQRTIQPLRQEFAKNYIPLSQRRRAEYERTYGSGISLPTDPEQSINYRARQMQKMYREVHCNCPNLSEEERANIHPAFLIKLIFPAKFRIIRKKGNEYKKIVEPRKCACYDVMQLYLYLTTKYGQPTRVVGREWTDPTYNKPYTIRQVAQIQNRWKQLSPCQGGSNIMTFPVSLSDDDNIRLPPETLEKLYANILAGVYTNLIVRIFSKSGKYYYTTITGFNEDKPRAPRRVNIEQLRADAKLTPEERLAKLKAQREKMVAEREARKVQLQTNIMLPLDLMQKLKVNEGDTIYVEECSNLQNVDFIQLKPISEAWFNDRRIDMADPEAHARIIAGLEDAISQHLIVSLFDPVIIIYTVVKDDGPSAASAAAMTSSSGPEMEDIPLTFIVVNLLADNRVVPAGIAGGVGGREVHLDILSH
jgi:hypothetical protein